MAFGKLSKQPRPVALAPFPWRAPFTHSNPHTVAVRYFCRVSGCGKKEVSFAGELTRKSRSFQEYLHKHPRVAASSIAEYIALHHYYPALLHCLRVSQTRPGTRNCNLSGCRMVATGRIAQSRARIPGVHQGNWNCYPAPAASRKIVFFARPSAPTGPAA